VKDDVRHPGQPFLQLPGELVGARCDARFSEASVELEGLRQSPLMLERLEPARRYSACGVRSGRFGASEVSLR
jgi:hypothetical protein